jgi:hypothetical protein
MLDDHIQQAQTKAAPAGVFPKSKRMKASLLLLNIGRFMLILLSNCNLVPDSPKSRLFGGKYLLQNVFPSQLAE